jgi:uncharacterized membrane protein YfcA
VYLSNGYFEKEYLFLIPFLVAIGFLGTYLGKLILARTTETIFRYLVLIVIIITSVIQIASHF